MAFVKKLGLVATLLFSINTFAGEEPPSGKKPSPQKSNKVVKDDTKEKPATTVNSYPRDGRDVKLYPRIRIKDTVQPRQSIPADAIAQFLSSPKVVNENDIDKSPYVVDFPDEHIVAGAGHRVYVRSILKPDTLNYTLYRKGQAYTDPETEEHLGFEAIYVADARLEKEGDPATLTITKSEREIRIGDRLMKNPKTEMMLNYFPESPDTDIKGHIINVLDGVSQLGKYNIVVIDRGIKSGIKSGHVFSIYQKGRTIIDRVEGDNEGSELKLPDEKAGTLMVFRPFKRVSYALIMEANKAIHILDKIRTPE